MARKCPSCGSRKWHKDSTGQVVCEDGHVLAGVREETLISEPTGHAMQKRRTTKGPRINKRREYGMANADFFHGQGAEYLRLQGLQLLLRHQVSALTKLWTLPDALEVVVRELWAYQLLITPVPNPEKEEEEAPIAPPTQVKSSLSQFVYTASQDDKKGSGSDTESDKDDKRSPNPEAEANADDEDGNDSDSTKSEHSAASHDTDAELMAQLSENSDGELLGGPDDYSSSGPPVPRKRPKLRVSDTLVCLVLGLWLLRIPFTHVDLEALVNTNQIPYIDFGRSTLVPFEMAKHMNRDVQLSLRPQRSPSPAYLHRQTLKFARILTRWYGQTIPEINVQPLAWHVVSQLGGSAVTHSQVVGFLHLIDANMSLNDTNTITVMGKRRNSESEATTHEMTARQQDIHMPELSVAAAWVVVMKLAYGLDGKERLAIMRSDPLVGMPKGEEWVAELERRVASGALRGTRPDLDRMHFDTMQEDAIDKWLDRCEDVLLKNRDVGRGQHLYQFPIHRLPRPAPTSPTSWADFLAAAARDPVRTYTPRGADLPLMPGEGYRSHDAADVTGTLPRALETVLSAAADVVGVPVTMVASTVELFERRMEAMRPRREYQSVESRAVRRVRGGALRESRSLDRALNELR